MVFGRDFFWVVLQFGAWSADLALKIGLFGNCHAANGVSPEVFPDQFVWIAVGQECATTYGPINKCERTAAFGAIAETHSGLRCPMRDQLWLNTTDPACRMISSRLGRLLRPNDWPPGRALIVDLSGPIFRQTIYVGCGSWLCKKFLHSQGHGLP